MNCLRIAAASAVLLLIMGACGAPAKSAGEPDDTKQARLVTQKCADVVVLGLRGSGQSPDQNSGLGQELSRSLRSMVSTLKADVTVRLEAVDYKSARTVNYDTGVADGRRQLHRLFTGLAKQCEDTTFAFIGFSQGAQAVHGYAFDLPADEANRVAFIAMMADASRNADDDITFWSYADKPAPRSGKAGAGEVFNSHTRKKAIDLCVAGDEICNWPEGGGPATLSQTHKHFYEKPANARTTGKQLAAALKRGGIG